MTTPTGQNSFNNYYNASPSVIIRDYKGRIYSFPSDKYNNGNGGSAAKESDSLNWYNGRKWGGYPWSDVNEIAIENYTNDFGVHPRNSVGDNCIKDVDLPTMNNQGSLPGYSKKSGGTYKNNTHDYIIADRGLAKNNWAFSLYLKKDYQGFLDDMNAANKSLFNTLLSNDCANGNQRYNGQCVNLCNNSTADNVLNNCKAGSNQWCRDDSIRIGSTYDSAVESSTSSNCIASLKAGTFDDTLYEFCNSNDKITKSYCADIRQNVGSTNIKYKLNNNLFNNYCNSDTNITSAACSDVRSVCNNTAQLVSNTAPYNCNSLVKGLSNDSNVIMMTSKLDLTNISSTTDKTALLNSFNDASTDAVEDALCALTFNTSDPICKTFNGIRKSEKNLKTIQAAIDTSIKTGGGLTQEVINFITTDFINLQNYRGVFRYPNSNLITPNLLSFCELSDPKLQTNLCSNTYTTYKTDPAIKFSIERINDYAFCIATNAFMGKSTNGTTDPYNNICIVRRDDPSTFAKYLPLAIKYCEAGDNILSPECIKYYNEVLNSTNNFIRLNMLNTGKSAFTNNEDNTENEDIICDNKHNYEFLFIMIICFILVLRCIKKYYYNKYKCNQKSATIISM